MQPFERRGASGLQRWLLVSGALALTITVLGVVAVATAGPSEWSVLSHRHGARQLDRALDHLGATDEQREQIEARIEQVMEELRELRAGSTDVARALADALLAEDVDRESLERVRAAEILRLEQSSARLVDAFAEIAEALTPEQRAALADHVGERLDRRGGWFRRSWQRGDRHHGHAQPRRGGWHHGRSNHDEGRQGWWN